MSAAARAGQNGWTGVVDPPGALLEAQLCADLERELTLGGRRERPGQRRRAAGARRSPRSAGRAPRCSASKTRAHACDGGARLVAVEQRVVGCAASGKQAASSRRSSTLRSRCGRRGEVVVGSASLPGRQRLRRGPRHLGRQLGPGPARARSWSRRATRTIAAASSSGARRPGGHALEQLAERRLDERARETGARSSPTTSPRAGAPAGRHLRLAGPSPAARRGVAEVAELDEALGAARATIGQLSRRRRHARSPPSRSISMRTTSPASRKLRRVHAPCRRRSACR